MASHSLDLHAQGRCTKRTLLEVVITAVRIMPHLTVAGLFDDYKPVLNVDLRAVDLGQHADLDGRDYMALFGLPPDGTR